MSHFYSEIGLEESSELHYSTANSKCPALCKRGTRGNAVEMLFEMFFFLELPQTRTRIYLYTYAAGHVTVLKISFACR